MIIDAHIHLWSRIHGEDTGLDREALCWGKARRGKGVYYATPPAFEDSQSTVERALAHMNWLGISRAVVYQSPNEGQQDRYLALVRQRYPQRFWCPALLTPRSAERPLETFLHVTDHLGLQGIVVNTPRLIPRMATRQLWPLWEECAANGLPVVVQNGVPSDVAELVRALPSLKVVLAHLAGGIEDENEHLERLEIAVSAPRVYLDTASITAGQRYPFGEGQERLRRAVAEVGAERIAWGSDYPRPKLVADASYRQQLEFITDECSFLSDAQRGWILGGTAMEVYDWGP